jgi:hypothetical protein
MDKKEYEEDCERCDISQRSILLPGGIIELQGDWILTQYNEKESFLGWMVLQPRYHRRELTDLMKDEGDFFVKSIQGLTRPCASIGPPNFRMTGLNAPM